MEWRQEVRLTPETELRSYLESIFSLRGKNALVTGAASGLGRRCAVVRGCSHTLIALLSPSMRRRSRAAMIECRIS
jgi:hypothetical protein